MSFLDRLASHVTRQAPARVAHTGRISDVPPEIGADFLKTILDAHDATPERKRIGVGEGVHGHYIHVSSLVDACPRMHALAALDDSAVLEPVTGGHRVMWKMGRFVEQHIRDSFMQATRRRMAFGHWTCRCGQERATGTFPLNRTCAGCGKALDVYGEYTLFDHDNWIVGNPDLLVLVRDWLVPVEIKSMNKKEWDALERPKGDHVFQLSHYHRMAALEGFKVMPFGIVIYCVKDFVYGSPYKEFRVDMTAPVVRTLLADSVEVARSLRTASETGTLPPRTLCASHSTTRAKKCPRVVACFSAR